MIGTFRGRSALNFALNSPNDCTVYTIDLPPDQRGANNTNTADRKIIEQSITGIDYRGQESAHKIKQFLRRLDQVRLLPLRWEDVPCVRGWCASLHRSTQ